jgi:hypothetical protein
MFGEYDCFTSFSEFSLCAKTGSESIVREFNKLYGNLAYTFNDDGSCKIVKITLDGGPGNVHRYVVSTADLFNIDAYSFRHRILRRTMGDFVKAEYKTMGMDDCYRLMDMIATPSNYCKHGDFVLFDDKHYGEFYDSVEGFEELDVFRGFTTRQLKQLITKEKKRYEK